MIFFLCFIRHFQQYFSYIMAISFSGGGRRCTRREPPTMGKQLANFIKILAAPAYGVYISQLTKYSRVGGSY
jgi:hypothetical protein